MNRNRAEWGVPEDEFGITDKEAEIINHIHDRNASSPSRIRRDLGMGFLEEFIATSDLVDKGYLNEQYPVNEGGESVYTIRKQQGS